ncbi:SCO5717 family growth-regulating ATPase [Streptomyces sp. M10(2022)]
MTGEFTIDYTPPAWYTQSASGDSSGGGGSHLAPPPPPAGSPVRAGTAGRRRADPRWTPAPPSASGPSAPSAPASSEPSASSPEAAAPGESAPGAPVRPEAASTGSGAPDPFGGGDLESGATMRFSPASLKREIAEREAAAASGAGTSASGPDLLRRLPLPRVRP